MAEGLEGLLTGHTLVKRYRIEEVCGRGGFAVVYRATDTRLGRPVAVKVITLTAEDPEQREVLRQRLHREARAAASLPHHPNLVTVHDVGTDPELGLDFLVMELLQGENLSQALQRGRPPLDRALRILHDAAEGLAVGHRAGLVHRDVKPGNIFLAAPHHEGDPDAFRVCLLDYGIAQAIEDDQTVTRGMGGNPLSPAFASPEQIRGERDLSPATDVFSLGVVGYQLLTGERPFATQPGQLPTGWTVRTPIRELNPEVAPAVEEVVMRAMSVDPLARFVDADAFAEALDVATDADHARGLAAKVATPAPGVLSLDEALEDDATMVAPAAPIHVVPPVKGPDGTVHRPVPPLRPPPHAAPRRRSKLPAVLVVVLLLAAAAAWAAMRGGGGGGEREADARPVGSTDTLGTAGAALDDAGNPVDPGPVQRTGGDVDIPAGTVTADDGSTTPSTPSTTTTTTTGGTTTPPSGGAQPSTPQPSQPSQPGVTQPPAAQPQPQPSTPQQPSPPPAQQPTQQPSRPPAQPQPQPQQPPSPPQAQPQPQPQQPRPEPPLLGRPIDQPPPSPSSTPAPRDTLVIPASPPGA